jgi:hypothetical protein
MILKTGPCFTSELELNCPTIVGCVTDLPLGPAAVAGTTQVLGKDGQYHTLPAAPVAAVPALSVSGNQLTIAGGNTVTLPDNDTQDLSISGNVISLTNGGSVTLPTTAAPAAQTLSISGQNLTISGGNTVVIPAGASTVFATPAETVAGTSTTLAVNPADLVARENIPAQTGLGLVLSAIPAPTAGQSPWGVNTLGETLHYAPGVGWKIVANLHGASATLSAAQSVPATTITVVNGMTHTMPRAGKISVSSSLLGFGAFNLNANYLMKNGVLFSRLGSGGAPPPGLADASDISGSMTDITVAAGDVFSLAGQFGFPAGGSGSWLPSLSRFSYQYTV